MTKAQQKAEQILRHGFALQRIFPATKGMGPVSLCKALHRLEMEAHRMAEDECNRPLPDGYVERKTASIAKRLDALLGFTEAKIPVFINHDPRGCALKIDDAYVREHSIEIARDWGGYGLICPEFS